MTLRKALLAAFAGGLLLASSHAVTADSTRSLSAADKTFIKKAAGSNLAEIQSSRMALQRSKNLQIQNIAGRMVQDHTKAQSALRSLARRLGVTLPTRPDTEHQKQYQRLAGLSGALFEDSYLRMQAADHNRAIALFQKQVTDGSNSRVQGYAARYLPKLQNHASMISRTASIMGVVVPRPSKVASASNGSTLIPSRGRGM